VTWKPTPAALRYEVRVYDHATATWETSRFQALRPGDVYAAFDRAGQQIDPSTGEPDDLCCLVTGEPFKNMVAGMGWTVEAEIGELEAVLALARQ
jgi:hypothetical protein